MRRRIHGLSADEIKQLSKDEFAMPITMQDFQNALGRIQSSVSAADLKRYDDWMKEFGARFSVTANVFVSRQRLIAVLFCR
jgi:katanin p60 ATPase-containing subunit A1